MNIFLFDMDGVLLESHGYHLALQETIRRMARALGFVNATLTADDIAAFEAGGITCEWDEAAICAALMLEKVWLDEPGKTLPESLAATALPINTGKRPLPDFNSLAGLFSTPDMLPLHPLERAGRFFLRKTGRSDAQEQILHDLILSARLAEISLTHRTFQELVLGSAEFGRTYDLPDELESESYLLTYDRSNLTLEESARLWDWMFEPDHGAAVITSRPSHPPAGIFSTPEAELGAKLVGLEGIPILGWGGMCWLGLQTHQNPQNFLKPSPVHALAGMRVAQGETQEVALAGAVELLRLTATASLWKQFEGAHVIVFEDTPGGIKSLQAAREVLAAVGITIHIHCHGIARNPVKREALAACGAQVHETLTDVLAIAFTD
jgi:beta-phosphoglucomutase-like phosphatase (HAD superfamily)